MGRDENERHILLSTISQTGGPQRKETGISCCRTFDPESRLAGTVFCGGVNEPHAIEGNPKLQEAFELGKNV